MELLQLEISSTRLLLKPISTIYKEIIFREFTEEITTYMYPRLPREIAETESFIQTSRADMAQGNQLVVVVLRKDSQEFLGCAGIHQIDSKAPNLGIWLKKTAHGQGYGTETITVLKEWAEANLDYKYLVYPVERANIPSRRIPEKLGGQIFREYETQNLSGKILNLVEYRIFKL